MAGVISNVFNRVYVMMKLSLIFWAISLMGGIILGVGPALLSVFDMYQESGWDYQDIQWRSIVERFFKNFKRGNSIIYLFIVCFSILGYNLYIASQVQGLPFLIIDFVLVMAIVFLVIVFLYALVISANYDISFLNLVKLSLISVFANFTKIFKLLLMGVLVGYITYNNKGLILFISVGAIVVATTTILSDWMSVIDERMEH